MAFVHDSTSKERAQIQGAVERHRDLERVATRAMVETSKWIEETDIDNLEKQRGHALSRVDFERRVQKICPQVRFAANVLTGDNAKAVHLQPGTKTRCMMLLKPDGTLEYLGGFLDQALIPEKSTILTRLERAPREITQTRAIKGALGYEAVPFINGKDIPTESVPGIEQPGQQWVRKPVGTIRGWRTVLAQLVHYGLATPLAIEREFGSLDSASWAKYMGRHEGKVIH